MAETVHLYFRAGGILHHLPCQFTAPGDVAGMNFSEVSGLTQEARAAGSRKVSLRVPLSWQSVSATPVLKAHFESKRPILMSLCNNEVVTGNLRPAFIRSLEDFGSYLKMEWDQ